MSTEAGTQVCPSCGAPVPKAAPACPWCGAPVVLRPPLGAEGPAPRRTFCARCGLFYPSQDGRCPRCPPAATDERGGRCPRCRETLEAFEAGRVWVDRCPRCRGLWFDGEELEHAVNLTTEGVSRDDAASLRPILPRSLAPDDPVRYLGCVRCGELMARRQVAPRSGVIVDVCRSHGVWFDGGEFDAFTEFARRGGLEVLRHDGTASAEARRAGQGLEGAFCAPRPSQGAPGAQGAGWVWAGAGMLALIRLLSRLLR